MGTAELEVGFGNRRHPDEVVCTAEECAERRCERLPAAGLHADGGGDHLLLGDVHLEEPVGVLGRESFRVGRVADLAVERDDALVDRSEPGQGVAVGAAGRDLLAELVARALDRLARDLVGGGLASGVATSIRSERSPPSSATAASGSSSGLPCHPSLSSTAATPEPFLVRAKITAGFGGGKRRRVGGVDLVDVMAVDLVDVPTVGRHPGRPGRGVPFVHRRAALTEPVDVDDRDQVGEAAHCRRARRPPTSSPRRARSRRRGPRP